MSRKRTAAGTTPATTAASTAATTPRTATIDSPRGGLLTAAALYAVVTLIFAYPALTGGFLVSQTSDQYIGGYAVRTFGAALWHATGHLHQWNPYILGGMPFIGSVNGDTRSTRRAILLRIIARPDVAVTWLFIVHEFLAGLFTYVFLRALGMSFIGALVGGLAYMMGGPIASYVSPGHDGKLDVSALFPLMGWTLARGLRDGHAWAWPALALITGLGILTPHPQLMQYSLVGAGAIGLYLAFWAPETRTTPQPVMIRFLLPSHSARSSSALMGAIQFAPVLEYIKYSPAPWRPCWRRWLRLVRLILDAARGIVRRLPPGVLRHPRSLLGPHGYPLPIRLPRRRRSHALGRVVLLTPPCRALVLDHGRHHVAPLDARQLHAVLPRGLRARPVNEVLPRPLDDLLHRLRDRRTRRPGRRSRYRRTHTPRVSHCLCCVRRIDRPPLRRGRPYLAAAALAAPDAYGDVLSNASAVTLGAVRALIAALGLATIVVLMARGKLTAAVGGWALVAVIALDLWSEERQYWKWSPPASITYASNPATDLLAQREPGRVLTLPTNRTVPGDVELEYDGLMIHKVRQVTGYLQR